MAVAKEKSAVKIEALEREYLLKINRLQNDLKFQSEYKKSVRIMEGKLSTRKQDAQIKKKDLQIRRCL